MIFVLLIPLFISLLILFLLSIKQPTIFSTTNKVQPFVSVLIAMRNEESNIIACLESLAQQSYSNFEVWVGDDDSNDHSFQLVEEFCARHAQFHVVNIEQDTNLKGKVNVLNQLTKKAQGECFLLTDADIQVNPYWVESMVSVWDERIGVVQGTTWVEKGTWFDIVQSIDWLFSQRMIKYLSDKKIPVTAWGNNLLISKKAYQEVGTYENIPFSVTEDFSLFHAIVQKGWSFRQVFETTSLAFTQAMPTMAELLAQRKRWTQGAKELKWWLKGLLFLHFLYYLVLPISLFLLPIPTICFAFIKWVLQSVVVIRDAFRLGQKYIIWDLFLYEIFQVVYSLLFLCYLCLPISVIWKGRKYN
ncbi:MAG: glycosyltransferase [Cytophagales bacterium]|nr:glycosyltransferase [Cytophagales bacterium]